MQVDFHLNVPVDAPLRLGYLCRLLAKAYAARAPVWVILPPALLEPLDQALWTQPADDFVPHVRFDAEALLVRRSPIVLATPEAPLAGAREVLVNAAPEWPAVLATNPGLARVIEIVGADDAEKAAARQRWRRYQAMGITPRTHDRARRDAATTVG
jgi:DNA polymerase-3 subunit chi